MISLKITYQNIQDHLFQSQILNLLLRRDKPLLNLVFVYLLVVSLEKSLTYCSKVSKSGPTRSKILF